MRKIFRNPFSPRKRDAHEANLFRQSSEVSTQSTQNLGIDGQSDSSNYQAQQATTTNDFSSNLQALQRDSTEIATSVPFQLAPTPSPLDAATSVGSFNHTSSCSNTESWSTNSIPSSPLELTGDGIPRYSRGELWSSFHLPARVALSLPVNTDPVPPQFFSTFELNTQPTTAYERIEDVPSANEEETATRNASLPLPAPVARYKGNGLNRTLPELPANAGMAPRALNTSAKSAHIGSVSGSRTFYSAVASWASPTSTEQQQFALEGHATSLDAGIRQHYFNELSPAIITQSSVDAVASTSTSSIDYATRGRILPPVVVAPAQLSTSTPAIAGTSTSANPMPQVVPPLSARAQSTPPGTFDASSSSNGANPSSSAASTASTPAGPRYLSDEWCEAAMPPCQSIEEAIRSWTMAEDGNAAVAELKMHGRIGIKDLSADKVKTLLEEVPIKPSGAWPLFLGQYKKYHSETARVQRGPGSNVPVDATGDMKEAAKVWAWMLPSRLGNPSPQVKWKALSEEMKTRHKEIFSGYDIGLRQVLQMLNTRLNKKKGRKASSTCPASSSTAVAATLPISSHTVDHPVQAPHSVALPPLNIPHPSHADHPPRSVTGSTEAASIPLAHSASALPVGQHADNGLFRYSQPIARRPNREIANSARMSPYPRPSTTPSYVSRNPALVHLSMARTSTTSSPANDLSLDHVPLLRTSSRMSTSSLTSCATPPPLSRQNSLTSISDIYEAGSRSMSATPGASTSFSNATLESSSDAAFAFSDFDDGNEESMNTMNDADNGYADFAGTTSTPNDGYGHRTSTSPTSGNTLNLDFGYEAPTPSNDILATTSTEESSTSINDFRYFGGSASSSTESTSAYPSWYGATPQDYQNAAATQWLELGYLTDSSEKSGPF